MPYYPDQRYASPLTTIKREVVLPDEAQGTVSAKQGQRVDVRDVVANGIMPARHLLIDVADFFSVRKLSRLDEWIRVERGDRVEEGDVLAGKSATRGKRLFSPVRGIITSIDGGRIILQEFPEMIDLEAGVRGRVTGVIPGRGVTVEAIGALVQGIWGNNRRTIATLRTEPEGGIANIIEDELDMTYRGVIVLTDKTVNETVLRLLETRGIVGLIAPSMDVSLMGDIMRVNSAILLTEGFGQMGMSRPVYTTLAQFAGRQVTLDAYMPSRWETRYPEVIVNTKPKAEERPSRPNPSLALRPGLTVRITRAPYAGQTGRVVEIPNAPQPLPNGLRVPAARVELLAGETVFVPLTNLEVLGR
jgi:hypothetical protein